VSEINKIVVGDLVKWFEPYDDMNIIKDAGSGTVIETQEVTNPYNPAGIPRYKVFCHKLCDTRWFYKPYIETFITKGDKNVRK